MLLTLGRHSIMLQIKLEEDIKTSSGTISGWALLR